MNEFELDKIMEVFGYDKSDCYNITDLQIYNDGKYFTIVEGRTPYELAQLINEKYPNIEYGIRVNGNNEAEVPSSDIYTYHIDTIEGLVAFLIETKNYYEKSKTIDEQIDDILSIIYKNILKNVNPQISIYDWMLDREDRKYYFKTILSEETCLDFKLRKRIGLLDNVINPFSNNNLDINSNKFIVNGCGYEDDNWFSLTDKESGITMSTVREKNGFVLKLHIPTDLPYQVNIYHCYNQLGEELAFETYNDSGSNRLEYNLTNKLFGEQYGKKHKATIKDKNFVIASIDEYINLARQIIEKNIDKQVEISENVLSKKISLR